MSDTLYKVKYYENDEIFEVFAKHVYQGDMYGFIAIEEMVFGENSTLVVDPSEERLKQEFKGVKTTYVPMHSILRIDEVEKRGSAKIIEVDTKKVARFPSSAFQPGKPSTD